VATITNVINTKFTNTGADKTASDIEGVTRATTRLGQASAGNARQFAAQASGLGGLVGAYAGAAATVFALQASFDALARSARALQTLEGLGSLANTFGQNASDLLNSVRDITKGQLTIAETAQQINLSLSSGFNTEQIEGLAGVALKASRALGRDLSDSFTRVVRGSAKLETELLDELGIFTKIEPATAAYAAQLGKSRLALTEFERRQAFVNAVIAEGERKFASINTTLPTTAEQIEAFGVKILDLATQIGGFLAQTIAPLASFLTNNLAGAFAAVGTAAGLIAAKGISVLKGSLDDFAKTAVSRGATAEQFFLKYSAAAKEARDKVQKDLSSLNLQKGIGGEPQAQLKALREAAATRILTGAEISKATELLRGRESKLQAIKASEQAKLQDLENERTQLQKNAATLSVNSAQYADNTNKINENKRALESQTKALDTTNTRLAQTANSLKLLQASAAGATSGIARVASTAVTGFISLGASVARTSANLVGFAGSALSIVSILSLVGAGIASAIGKQDEYNAVLAKFGSLIKNFFTSKNTQSLEKGLLSVSAEALQSLENVDPALKNIEEFRFTTKFLGVSIDVSKTKEDLVREVTAALSEAAQSGNKTFGEQLSDNALGVGTGALLGKALGEGIGTRAVTAIGARFGSTLGGTLGAVAGPVGMAAGALLGAGIGFGVSKFFESNNVLSDDVKNQLKQEFGSGIFSGASGQQLEVALQKIEEQAGAAKNLSFEGRKYYETQQRLAVQLTSNLNNIQQTQQVAERLGIDLAQLQNKFEITVTDKNIVLSPNLRLNIPIKLTIVDQEDLLEVADTIQQLIDNARNPGVTAPKGSQAAALQQMEIARQPSLVLLNIQLEEAQKKLEDLRKTASTPIDYTFTEAFAIPTGNIDPGIVYLENEIAALQAAIDAKKRLSEATKDLSTNLNDLKNSFVDAGEAIYRAQTSSAQFESALLSVNDGVKDGSLNLETLAQAENAAVTALNRTIRESVDAKGALAELQVIRAKIASSNVLTLDDKKQLAVVDASIAALQTESNLLETNVGLQKDRLAAVQSFIEPYKQQLEVLEKIKRTFGDLVNEPLPKMGEFDVQGNYIFGEKNRQAEQYAEITRRINETAQANDKVIAQETAINALAQGRADATQFILTFSNLTADSYAKTAQSFQGIPAGLQQAVNLSQQDLLLAKEYNQLLIVRQNLTRQLGDELLRTAESVTTNLSNINNDLKQKISDLANQKVINTLQFEIDMLDIKAQGEQAAFEFEQAFRQNQIKLIELKVDNKKIDPTEGAGQVNKLEKEILDLRKQALEAELVAGAERYLKESQLLTEKLKAEEARIGLEAAQTDAKIKAEYDLLIAAATTYSAISGQMSTAIITGANAAGQAIVDAAYAAAQTLASALGPLGKLLGVGSGLQKFAFTPQATPGSSVVNTPAGPQPVITDPALLAAVNTATNKYNETLASSAELRSQAITAAQEANAKEKELLDANYRLKADDIVRRAELLAQEMNISQEEAEQRLREAGGSGDRELTALEERLKALFTAIKGNIENTLMSLNNLVFYGEGSFNEIMSGFFKNLQQDFFKTTVAEPVSDFLTTSLFSALGVEGAALKKGTDGLSYQGNSLLVKVTNAFDFMNPASAVTDKVDPTGETKGIFGGFFDQITSLFTNIFGQNGVLSGLFKGLFGQGGILSGLFSGVGGIFSGILSFFGASQGGLVHLAAGGAAASASLNRDRVPAMLEPGEFVIRKQSAERIGMPALQAMNSTGGAPSGGNVFVNVTNEGSPKQAEASAPRFDGEKYVVDIVMRDIANNGPIRRTLRGRGGL
jgi:NACalpha-BTF3-like transcription factor